MTRFAVAGPDDDAAIRALLRGNPMRGSISLRFEREPNYFHATILAGGIDQTVVAYSRDRVVCMGRCTFRDCWVNGAPHLAGYLAELRLDGAARRRISILRRGYEFFESLQPEKPAALYFTSIAADNQVARRLLESGASGLPGYTFLDELETLLIAIPSRPRSGKVQLQPARPAHVPELLRLLNDHGRRHQLAKVWTRADFEQLPNQGLPLERFLLALDSQRIIACGALWDQRPFRQTVVHAYSRALTVARPFVNAVSRLLGSPRLPHPGSVLAHVFLSPLAFIESAEEMLSDFVAGAFTFARPLGAEFLTISLPATDKRIHALRRRFSTRTWRSRLYRVDWAGRRALSLEPSSKDFFPESALL